MISLGIIASSGKGGVVLYVYGSGTPAIHRTYVETGSYNGFPLFVSQNGLIQLWNEGTRWTFTDIGVFDGSTASAYFYEKTSSEASPLLVTNWSRGDLSTNPPPIVSPTPPNPVGMNYTGAGSGNPQPVDVPETATTNGKPEYYIHPPSESQFRCSWTDAYPATSGFAWVWTINTRFGYWSNEDVDYPSDVSAWNVDTGEGVSGPAPTVTAVY